MKIKPPYLLIAGSILMFAFYQFSLATAITGFSDVDSSNPNYTAIMDLKSRGIIGGYSDGTFKPNQEVNRVEALKIILLGAKIEVPDATTSLTFKDTNSSEWYAKYLLKAVELKIVQGYADGTFKPTQTVNLAENLKMLINTKQIDLSGITVNTDPYADTPATEWYAKFIQYAKEHNWVTADSSNKVYPGQGMTRGKLAQLIYNSLQTTPPSTQQTQQNTQQTQQQTQQNWQTDYVLNVSIKSSAFIKNTMTIGKGTTVKWTNNDTVTHQVAADGGQFLSPILNPGDTWTYTFNSNGTFAYHCSLHSSMKGSIIVKNANEVPTI